MKSKYISKIKPVKNVFQNNKQIPMFAFSFEKKKGNFETAEIQTKVEEVRSALNNYKEFNNIDGSDIQLSINVLTGMGWANISHGFKTSALVIELTDFTAMYNEDLFDKLSPLHIVSIIVRKIDNAGGASKFNDCLFYAVRDAIGKDYLPSKINLPSRLKKLISVPRNDKVPISKIPRLENAIKYNINITGDSMYKSENKYAHDINIVLKNGHYEQKSKFDILFRKHDLINLKKKQIRVFKLIDGIYNVYDGNRTIKLENPFDSNFHNILATSNDIITFYNEYIEFADELVKISKNTLDLYKCGSIKNAVKYLLSIKSNFSKHEQIDQFESDIISKTYIGGLMAVKNSGPHILNNASCYDINKSYATLLQSKSFKLPYGKPVFETIDNLDNLKYGIYKCKIDITNPLLMRKNKHDLYTHMEIKFALKLNFKVELIKCKNNAIIYNKLVYAHRLFKPAIDYLIDLLPLSSTRIVKNLLNNIYGFVAEKYKFVYNNKQKIDLPTDQTITNITPAKSNYVIETTKYCQYKTNYARFAPFITATNRIYLASIINNFADHVYRVQTDSFIVDSNYVNRKMIDKYININDNIGSWKVEFENRKCRINNISKIEIFDNNKYISKSNYKN